MTTTSLRSRPVPPAVEAPDADSLEGRASLAFKVVAVVDVAGMVLALIRGSIPASTLLGVAFNVAAGTIAVAYLLFARGLDQRRPWATVAVRPMLLVLGIAGAYAVVAAASGGRLRIPFELVLAGWALVAPRDTQSLPIDGGGVQRNGARGAALVAVATAMALEMAFGHLVFGWGGVLDVRREDLVASLEVDCGPPDSGLPATVTITYDWHWVRTAPLPNEVDTIVLGWSGDDPGGHPLYSIKEIHQADAIRPGGSGVLTQPMADAARAESRASYRWGVDLDARGYEPGSVGLVLALTPREVQPESGTLTVPAAYVHLDVWRKDAETVTCSW